jgi:hypothetical protein
MRDIISSCGGYTPGFMNPDFTESSLKIVAEMLKIVATVDLLAPGN